METTRRGFIKAIAGVLSAVGLGALVGETYNGVQCSTTVDMGTHATAWCSSTCELIPDTGKYLFTHLHTSDGRQARFVKNGIQYDLSDGPVTVGPNDTLEIALLPLKS